MNTTTTTSFINIISELAVSTSNLLDETDLAFKNHCISEEEYEGYTVLYRDLYDLICDFNIGETSPNAFLRNLYDIAKSYEKLGNTTYTNSMFDLLANTFVELAEINLSRKDSENKGNQLMNIL